MLHTRIWHAKLSPYYCTYLLFNLRLIKEQEQDSLQVIRLFIHEWDRRSDWLQTTAKHNVVWSIWAGDRCELSCAHVNREWKFYTKSHELVGAFFGLSSWLSTRPFTARAKRGLPLRGCRTIVRVLRIFFSRLHVDAFKFPTPVCQFIQQSLCIILLWQMETCNQNRIFLWNFHDFG